MRFKLITVALAAAGLIVLTGFSPSPGTETISDPLLRPDPLCAPGASGTPPLLRQLVVAATETAPFPALAAQPALDRPPPLYGNLGNLQWKVSTRHPRAQAYFNQGLVLAFAFNHAESRRAFREAQKLDPECAMCFWGEALVLGPNINAPMMPEAQAPALAALERARALAGRAAAKERALIEALARRYSADPKAERAALDAAYAAAMKDVARRFAKDDTVQVLHAEALMDTQPWDYWEARGTRPKGSAGEIVAALERVLQRNPRHPGAVHLYIHAMEASAKPEKALRHAERLGNLAPGAGHLVHMPAHIYYRLGMYRKSLETNKRAMAVDERYFATSPSDPLYRFAYYPHNIHFVMVSAQMGGDGPTAIEAAGKLDASIAPEVARKFALMQPVKAAPYTTHALFSDPATILALPKPAEDLLLVKAMYHYARALAHAARNDAAAARGEIATLARIESEGDYKPFAEWGVPAKEVVQTARLVAEARLADAMGDLDAAARGYEEAVFIEDSLAYMEPPYWYYPVRQSLGGVRLRQGKLDAAGKAFRDSLARVRNNGWAIAGLAETYRLKGDARGEREAREAFRRAWFGGSPPDLARL